MKSRSFDHAHWWEPEHWKLKARSVSSASLEAADPENIRNGWLTLEPKAQYHQKQLAEREHKMASLYEAQQARALERVRHSASNSETTTSPTPPPPHVPHGKVRQMFEERRSKGIDKSYPLQPIHNTDRHAARNTLTNGKLPDKITSKVTQQQTRKQLVAQKTENRVVNGSSMKRRDVNHNHETTLNKHTAVKSERVRHMRTKGPNSKSLAQTELRTIQQMDEMDKIENNNLISDETFPETLAPLSPELEAPEPQYTPTRPPRKNPPVKDSPVTSPRTPTVPPRRGAGDHVTNSRRPQPSMQKTSKLVSQGGSASRFNATSSQGKIGAGSGKIGAGSGKIGGGRITPGGSGRIGASGGPSGNPSAAASAAPGPPGESCPVCGRKFAPDRLARHEEICRKTANKKRKPFDALKHRLAGTEAEPFLNKLRKMSVSKMSSQKGLNSTWRTQHKDFINTIRAAKQVSSHLASGGKLSDLPPPPPSENADYVQCPHCNRRFNKAAAERHIPKCANFQFNKPKPGSRRR